MGKETKIGLAIVGTMSLVFATLLVRKLVEWDRAIAATAEANQGSPQAMADRRHAVAARDRDSAPRQLPEQPAEPMPERFNEAPAESRSSPFGAEGPAEERAPADPFARGGASQVDRDEQRIDDSQAPERLSVAGVRQASAEEPLSLDEIPDASPATGPMLTGDAPAEPRVADGSADESTPWRDEDTPQNPADVVAQPAADLVPVSEPFAEPASSVADQTAWRGAPEPTPPADGKYTVQPNDNLWIISEKVYGSGRYFKALAEHNRPTLARADRLQVGSVISVPPVSMLEQNYPALCPKQRRSAVVKPRTVQASARGPAGGGNVYVVEEGDTLFDIARYELGRASRWAEIYDLNRETLGDDFDYLQPGTELVMPPKTQRGDAFTRQPDSGYQR